LARQNDEDTLSEELENRLDDLFGEDDKFSEGPVTVDSPQDYPLSELKNLVLSIDWEITDEVLQQFVSQIRELKSTYKDDKINLTFLQILGSLGEYIKTNRGKAHPKTFKILNSVFAQFDDVVVNEGMQEIEKKKILRAEMNKYKVLREQITQDKAAKKKKRQVKSVEPVKARKKEAAPGPVASAAPIAQKAAGEPAATVQRTAVNDDVYADQITNAVEDIKRFIKAELKKLREELKLSRK
jgi:DNA-binding protein H-NS